MEKNAKKPLDWTAHPRWYYGFIFLIGTVLVVTSHGVKPEWEFIISGETGRIVLKELGFALIIAIILVGTVEVVTRRRHEQHMESMHRNIFEAVYGRYIPDDVFLEVERCLLSASVIRDKYTVDYKLRRATSCEEIEAYKESIDLENYLYVNMTSTFQVVKITDAPAEFDLALFVELPVEESLHDIVEITRIKIGDADLNPAEIFENVRIASSENDGYSHKVFLKKHTLSGKKGTTLDVIMSGVMLKRNADVESWSSRLPSRGITVNIGFPQGLKVQASANHSQSLEKIFKGPNDITFTLNHGIFPFQSIVFWWSETNRSPHPDGQQI